MTVERISSFFLQWRSNHHQAATNEIIESAAVKTYAEFSKRWKGQTTEWKQLSAPKLIHHYNSTTGSGFMSQPSVAPQDLLQQAENNQVFFFHTKRTHKVGNK